MMNFTYPEPKMRRSGIKVSWLYYDDHATALRAAEVAIRESRHRREQGYDFGYCAPGSIVSKPADGLYEVCVP